MILAGDVGGTKVHLGLFAARGARLEKSSEALLATREILSLGDELCAFAGENLAEVRACVLGVAGAIVSGRVQGANLPWLLDEKALSAKLSTEVRLINDLEASAWGLDEIPRSDLVTLQEGVAREGANRALISPGTGLGEAILLREGERFRPVASEGGHADFAPRTDEEISLLRFLRTLFGRVSCERVVSGPGIVNVFRWLRESGAVFDDSDLPSEGAELHEPEIPAAITAAALSGSSQICRETMRVWTAAFGAAAGNLALRGVTVSGVYLGGGIPARIVPLLEGGEFLAAFRDKAPQADLLADVPVLVVTNPETALLGACRVAARAVSRARP